MSKGKIAAQASHASLEAYLKTDKKQRNEWRSRGAKKIIVEAEANKFSEIIRKAERLNISYHKVKDAGHTEIKPGSKTAIGLGPEDASKIDKITSQLKLVK